MAKAVAVPYVIALILGIIVVAVIGYWFFVVAGGGGGQLSRTECQSRFVAYCTEWSLKGYGALPGDQTFIQRHVGCTAYVSESYFAGADEEEDCRAVLGQT